MMFPCLGVLRGTQTTTRASPSTSSTLSLTVSRSFAPASVSLATTRIVFMKCCSCSFGGRLGVGARRRGLDLGRCGRPEDSVHGARDAVLVGPADDGGHLVEVEDRRRRGHL